MCFVKIFKNIFYNKMKKSKVKSRRRKKNKSKKIVKKMRGGSIETLKTDINSIEKEIRNIDKKIDKTSNHETIFKLLELRQSKQSEIEEKNNQLDELLDAFFEKLPEPDYSDPNFIEFVKKFLS